MTELLISSVLVKVLTAVTAATAVTATFDEAGGFPGLGAKLAKVSDPGNVLSRCAAACGRGKTGLKMLAGNIVATISLEQCTRYHVPLCVVGMERACAIRHEGNDLLGGLLSCALTLSGGEFSFLFG